MGLFNKLFGTKKTNEIPSSEAAAAQKNDTAAKDAVKSGPTDEELARWFQCLTSGTLVATYKKRQDETLKKEYIRRLTFIGFDQAEAEKMFDYELSILTPQALESLSDPEYMDGWYFTMKDVLLEGGLQAQIDNQVFLVTEVTKIWDEAEYLYQTTEENERDLFSPVWDEIYRISRYGGNLLLQPYLREMSKRAGVDQARLQYYAAAEQQMMFKYKWNPDDEAEQHPYGAGAAMVK